MDYAKLDKKIGSQERVNVDKLIQGMAVEHEDLFNSTQIELSLELKNTGLMLAGNSDYFYIVINNLILNAKDALIDSSNQDKTTRQIHIHSHHDEQHCCISVRDNGVGIAVEDMPKIYEAFFSTKPRSGIGLGMSFVHKIISSYGGTIEVESELGQGTTFTLVLPLASLND